ncbi:hypothetical protein FHX81_5506 [Saccharothrix saharensis]|uniref:Lipoprotein n=1 Tax=Saccharothrix saharensis TaxID=571190 RepID=A0A543JJY9_9PSEU|nr:hypothetical protein [Saccharothrix saharensis]TQM83091.1 hypothetical protein FHX81_5506 [Saccharothrix saharensis]
MGPRLLPAVVGALLLAGCASRAAPVFPVDPGYPGTYTQTATPAPPTPPPTDFPVHAVPRPIVLFAPKLVTVEWVGSEEEKLSQGHGYRFTGVEPPTPGPTSVVLPDGPATFPLIDARDALAAMSAGAREGDPVEIVGAEPGTATFTTDRGPLDLPAWLFRSSFGSRLAWPAMTPDAFWKQGAEHVGTHHAKTSDGVRLEVELGAPETPCRGQEPSTKEPVVTETETAVVVGVRTIGVVGECARTAVYRPRYYPVTLAEPLGARVLVFEGDNSIIPVTEG